MHLKFGLLFAFVGVTTGQYTVPNSCRPSVEPCCASCTFWNTCSSNSCPATHNGEQYTLRESTIANCGFNRNRRCSYCCKAEPGCYNDCVLNPLVNAFPTLGRNLQYPSSPACFDGGPGSTYSDCPLGRDCSNCGPRVMSGVSPTPPPPAAARARARTRSW